MRSSLPAQIDKTKHNQQEASMYKLLATAAVALCVATPALAQSVPEKTGVNSTLGISPSTQDFVTEAANSYMLEIESSKLVAAKADAKDKAFADQMIKDHTATSAELKALVSSGKVQVNLPSVMDKAHGAKLDKLNSLNGADFTKTYEDMQVSAHKDAVPLFERYAKGGDNLDLKAFAAKTLPHLRDHLKMAQDLNK
jgi:putative membrane protein